MNHLKEKHAAELGQRESQVSIQISSLRAMVERLGLTAKNVEDRLSVALAPPSPVETEAVKANETNVPLAQYIQDITREIHKHVNHIEDTLERLEL